MAKEWDYIEEYGLVMCLRTGAECPETGKPNCEKCSRQPKGVFE